MPTVKELPRMPGETKRKRVAAYARVSSGKDAMLHSLAAQVGHYRALIGGNPEWEFAGVYSDEGVSGTKESRPGFDAMMKDASEGRIDAILTKAISRFARNVAALLKAVRTLKARGVDVYFEEEGIHTLSEEGELFMTLAAAMAEGEAKDVSEAMLWRIRRDMERGLYWGGTCPYGFRVKGRSLVQDPGEAEVVRRMFAMYLSGMGDQAIAAALNREKIPGGKGSRWQGKTVREVLTNVAHKGDLLLQKTYRPDFLTKKDAKNRGQRASYYVENAHEPIVSPEDFDEAMAARRKRAERAKAQGPSAPKSPLSRKVKCPLCGHSMRRKGGPGRAWWSCRIADRMGRDLCPGHRVGEERLLSALRLATGKEEEATIAGLIESATPRQDGTLEVILKDGTTKKVTMEEKTCRRKKGK